MVWDNNANRDFKGVWIPKDIWLDAKLSITEKILLVEIDSLCGAKGCWATNQYFADFLHISKDRVSKLISGLVQKEYLKITIKYIYGTKQVNERVLFTTTPYRRKQLEGIGENNYTPIVENNQDNNTTTNNIINNTTTDTVSDKNCKVDKEVNVVVDTLCQLGTKKEQAIKLISDYGLDAVEQQVDAVKKKKGIDNVIGWIVAALRDGYQQRRCLQNQVSQSQTIETEKGRYAIMAVETEQLQAAMPCVQVDDVKSMITKMKANWLRSSEQ